MSLISHHFDAVAAGVEDRNQEVHVKLFFHLFYGFIDFLVSIQSLDVVWLFCVLRIPSIHLKKYSINIRSIYSSFDWKGQSCTCKSVWQISNTSLWLKHSLNLINNIKWMYMYIYIWYTLQKRNLNFHSLWSAVSIPIYQRQILLLL